VQVVHFVAQRIRTKDQKIVPFKLNKAQKLLLNAVMDQLERRGFVRLTILKGRQMGSSTYRRGVPLLVGQSAQGAEGSRGGA
jgi:hypothetical protein